MQLSINRISISSVENLSLWPILILNLNLPISERVKQENMLCVSVIIGSRQTKDLDSFLRPLLNELSVLRNGVTCWNATTQTTFKLCAHMVLITGDQAAASKLCGHSGANSYNPCRMCSIRGIPSGGAAGCPLTAPTGSADNIGDYDPLQSPLHTNSSFRHRCHDLRRGEDVRRLTPDGIARAPALIEVPTLIFPGCCPIDSMPGLFEGIQPILESIWTDPSLCPPIDDQDTGPLLSYVSKSAWKEIGRTSAASRSKCPSSFGDAPGDVSSISNFPLRRDFTGSSSTPRSYSRGTRAMSIIAIGRISSVSQPG